MHEALDSLDAVALRDGVVGSREEFALAAYLCGRAFETKTNIARSPRLEYMLWLCGRRDIKSAMESCGPKEEENEFIVAVFSAASEERIIGALHGKKRPLGIPEKAQPLDLERISLSRVRN